MRTLLLIIAIFFFSLNGEKTSREIIKKIPFSNRTEFSSKLRLGIKTDKAVFLNKHDYKLIFENEKIESDSCYLFGKFKIDKNRIGVYCLRITSECDHRIELVELLVFDHYKMINSKTIMFKDNHVYYEISCQISEKFDFLNLYEKSESEYSMENGIMDTLFINNYKIDLMSKKLDTIYKKSTFELLKNPPQKN